MSKRFQNFERNPRDFYPTPKAAVEKLKGFLDKNTWYCEPCAGNGALIKHLDSVFPESVCIAAFDIEPQEDLIIKKDANDLSAEDVLYARYIITNPPFSWDVLPALMDKFISLRPTILLLPADYMHNKRFAPYLEKCFKIVSIGRLKWIEGSKSVSTENYCWYFFYKNNEIAPAFYGR